MSKPLPFIPTSVNFSVLDADLEHPFDVESSYDLPLAAMAETSFLTVLQTLPNDKQRVIALMLFVRNEMGFDYTYEDIASLWGNSKVNIFNTIQRMQRTLIENGLIKLSRH